MQAVVPPQMMRDRRGRRDRHLAGETLHHAHVGGVGAGPALLGEHHRGLVDLGADVLEDLEVPALRHRPFERRCRAPGGRSGSPSRRARPNARASRCTWRAPSRPAPGRYSRCSTLSRKRITSSMKSLSLFHSSHVSRLRLERQQTAVRALPRWSRAGRQRDLGAEVRGRDLEAELAVMLGHRPVHLVDEDDVGLAGREPGLDQLLEERAGVDRAALRSVLGRAQDPFGAVAHRLHELVGDEHAVVEVQSLAVEVARGLADLEELLDLRVRDVEIAGGRAAAQRALG